MSEKKDELIKIVGTENVSDDSETLDAYSVLTNCWPVRIVAGGILVKHNGQDRTLLAESLISAAKMRPCNELQKALSGKVAGLYAIGDCVEPRRIINAVWEAFHTARKIEG